MEDRMNVICLIPVDPKDRGEMADIPYQPYAGSREIACGGCNNLCWIGPRQTVMKTLNPSLPVLCMICIAKECQRQKEAGEEVTGSVISLGG